MDPIYILIIVFFSFLIVYYVKIDRDFKRKNKEYIEAQRENMRNLSLSYLRDSSYMERELKSFIKRHDNSFLLAFEPFKNMPLIITIDYTSINTLKVKIDSTIFQPTDNKMLSFEFIIDNEKDVEIVKQNIEELLFDRMMKGRGI